MQWLQAHPEVIFTVTINGPYHDIYRKTVSGIGSLGAIMGNIRLVQRKYPNVWEKQIQFISNAVHIEQIKPICTFFCNNIKKPPLSITHIREQDGNEDIKSMLRHEDHHEMDKIRDDYYETQDPYLDAYFKSGIELIKSRKIYSGYAPGYIGSCLPLMNKLYVYYDGKFGICEATCDKVITGDVHKGYDYALLKRVYDKCAALYSQHCIDCWAQRLCTVCFKDIILPSGKINTDIDSSWCKASKQYVLDQLVMCCELYGKSNGDCTANIPGRF